MKAKFEITITKFNKIEKLPNSWVKQDLVNVLELCDFGVIDKIADNELLDYVHMSLQEKEPEESATILMDYKLGSKLNEGQIQNLSHDIQEESLWEEYQDMSLHEELFNITSLLYKAYNGKFPHAVAADLTLEIKALNHNAEEELQNIDETILARIFGFGQTDHAVINRLFDEKIISGDFPEAKDIIWQYSAIKTEDKSVQVNVITALYWIKELNLNDNFEIEILTAHE